MMVFNPIAYMSFGYRTHHGHICVLEAHSAYTNHLVVFCSVRLIFNIMVRPCATFWELKNYLQIILVIAESDSR